jgi:hypothetical protein
MAATRILWIEELFNPKAEVFQHLLDVAQRWEAAIELLRFKATDTPAVIECAPDVEATIPHPAERIANGGVEADAAGAASPEETTDDGGVEATFGELVKVGRAGGRISVSGTPNDILAALDRTAEYSLVAVGDAFLDKGKAARMRLGRELGNTLHEKMKVAVVRTEEMKQQYLFGPRQFLSMLACFGLTALVYVLVFSNQQAVLGLLARPGTPSRVLAAVLVALFVPLVAFTYGKATHYLLKLMRME